MFLKKYLTGDRLFYRELLTIGLPIVFQNFLTSSLNLVDTLMVGRLGERAIASIGVANQVWFVLSFIMIGISAGAGIFIAQFMGNKDPNGMRRSLGVSLLCASSFGFLFMALALLFPNQIIGLFSQDPDFIAQTRQYFQVVCFSYPLAAISISLASGLKSTGRTLPPMFASAVAVSLNIILNYGLIFGNFGLPAMGIRGAAVATLIARSVELLIIISQIYLLSTVFAGSPIRLFSFSKDFFLRLMKPISHTVGNEMIWTIGIVTYNVAYGRLGVEALAVAQIYAVLQSFFSIFFYGIANASIVLVGREVGAGHVDTAYFYGRRLTLLGFLIAIVISGFLFTGAPLIVSFFELSGELADTMILTLRLVAIPFIGFAVDTVLLTGVLRGGGDTKVPLIIELLTMWCFGVPLAFLGCVVLKLPIYLAIPLVNLEEILKATLFTRRLLSNKWAKNLVGNKE